MRDKERAPIVIEAFERYATGKFTLDNIRAFFSEKGIRSRYGKELMRGTVTWILSNTFYYGQ